MSKGVPICSGGLRKIGTVPGRVQAVFDINVKKTRLRTRKKCLELATECDNVEAGRAAPGRLGAYVVARLRCAFSDGLVAIDLSSDFAERTQSPNETVESSEGRFRFLTPFPRIFSTSSEQALIQATGNGYTKDEVIEKMLELRNMFRGEGIDR